MPVVAMKCTTKRAHERTDQLFIYTFSSPAQEERTIVANLTNVYEVGDIAAIAVEGTWLPEGEIVARPVFGVPSSGMALGVVDAALDADLTERFDADQSPRAWRLTFSIEVEGRYPADAEKAARKAMKGGAGDLVGAERA